ncbi:MAG: RagB/SusD family nutrient uptake outer membrane protein [Lentimicrobiaceae bacterium]|nr:RagB/SusD family nutrient uptake outer membrane protein [Lentimicrobiaceae bacterium]
MKKITHILIAGALILGSCNDLLDIEPTDAISDADAIKDKTGVNRAVTGAYNALQQTGSYGRYLVIVEDLAADNLKWSGTTQSYGQIDDNQIPAENTIIDGIWASVYDCINRVNNVIYRIPDIDDLTPSERDSFEGEALFLRALCHFNLVSLFGAVPLKTLPTLDLSTINQARDPVDEVYAQVIDDLLQAELKLPQNNTLGRAGSYSATALLARVYLTQYHLKNDPAFAQLAIAKAEKVINDGGYILAPSFGDLFTGNTTESIFEVVFDAQNRNVLAQYFYPRSLLGRYEVSPLQEFLDSWEADDTLRFNATIAFDPDNLPYGYKYRDVTAGTDRVYVLRLAEMYLIRAEAMAYTSGNIEAIQNDINVIRSRAGLLPTSAADYNALKLAVQYERRHEFAFECQRWNDMVRTKTATIILGIDEDYTLFPIPLSEMQTNTNMTQNPGY